MELKVGKLISNIRKNKGLTQQELANRLGVSSKTISKWECGNGLPDVSMLKKVSEILEISVEELLEGKLQNKQENKLKKSKIIKYTSMFFITIFILIIIININNLQQEKKLTKENNCIAIKTYDIKNIEQSNDENYLYITISEYQTEGIFTIKLPISLAKDLHKEKAYVFTFKTTKENINVPTDILFNNAEVINIEFTDKIGMERENKSYCNDIK